jgi:hypothetical protein
MKNSFICILCCVISGFLFPENGTAQNWETVKKAFAQAPDSTRTRVWWFWGETIVTREGITADLEAMKKTGIGGVVLYEQLFGNRTDAIKTLTPGWFKLVRFAGEECVRLGLQFDITVSSGYCAGGPWITPQLSMKRLIGKEFPIAGNTHFKGILPPDTADCNFYQDIALLAYKSSEGQSTQTLKDRLKLSSNNPNIDLSKLFFGNTKPEVKILPTGNISSTQVTIEFPAPFEARSISYAVQPTGKMIGISMQLFGKSEYEKNALGFKELPPIGQLEASTDGILYSKVCDLLPIYRSHETWKNITRSFPATRAKFFRLNLKNTTDLILGKVLLKEDARIDQWELKAANRSELIIPGTTPEYTPTEALATNDCIDITKKLKTNGELDWEVPPGNWKVIRLGYISTNAKTKHGRPEAMGLECDKLNAVGIDKQFENYPEKIIEALKDNTRINIKSIHIDSAEHGDQNWTDNFIDEFKKRRGYDPTPYLPAMMGYVIMSSEISERFLHDVRRTIADMLADNYFGRLNDLAHKHNLTLTAQAPGNALCIHGDPIQCKSRVDIPQGEFWVNSPNANYDVKEASSASHLYNKPIASGEAFTGAEFKSYPDFFKPFADGAYAMGINEFVICASTYQPWLNRKPGSLTYRTIDMFQRNNTWWDYSRDFWDYQSRMSYMMRIGKATVDYCYYLGENIPVKIISSRLKPAPPSGFDFDVCTPEALLTRFAASEGKFILPDGAGYRLLVLPDTNRMSLAVARKIKELVQQGGIILGRYPEVSPCLTDLGKGDNEIEQIANELWGENKKQPSGLHLFGKGKVFWGKTIEQVMAEINEQPDLSNGTHFWNSEILFTHRKTDKAHIYFVANHKNRPEKSVFTFRVGNLQPELWDPTTGKTRELPNYNTDGKSTSIPLEFYPNQSYLIIFRNPAVTKQVSVPNFPSLIPKQDLSRHWTVHFDPQWGGPETIIFDSLTDWRINSNAGIKYYSGTARYEKEFEISTTKGEKLILSLGDVANIARVKINDKPVGNVWCKPWQTDISAFIKNGKNKLEIEVANQWVNRLIGDSMLPEDQKVAFTTFNNLSEETPLTVSGLLGPVQILTEQ